MARSNRLLTLAAAASLAALVPPVVSVPAGAQPATTASYPAWSTATRYTASGARFRHISASVYLRNPTQYAGEVASFGHSVQLWSSGLVITAGLTASTAGSAYTPYATVYDRSTHQVIAANPNAQYCEPSGDCSFDPRTFSQGMEDRDFPPPPHAGTVVHAQHPASRERLGGLAAADVAADCRLSSCSRPIVAA